jgi:hypothetical protein
LKDRRAPLDPLSKTEERCAYRMTAEDVEGRRRPVTGAVVEREREQGAVAASTSRTTPGAGTGAA